MRNTWTVTWTMLKMQYTSAGKHSNAWIYIFLAVMLVPFFMILLNGISSIIAAAYHFLAEVNQESLLLGFVLLVLAAVIFILSIVMILSAFYFSDDITAYIPLPLHPYQLLIGKAANPLIYNYLLSALLFLPFLFIYGSISNAPLLFYIYGFILFIIFPAIPFAVAAMILMFIMRYVNIAKNKDRSKIFMGIGSLLFIIFINVIVRLNMDEAALVDMLTTYMQEQEGLLRMVTVIYPPAYFGASSLHFAGSWFGFLFLISVIGIFAISVFLFVVAGQRFYLKGVRGMSSGSMGTLSDKASSKLTKQRAIRKTYIRKEIKIILRTPVFLMQCVVQTFFFPIFLTIILFLDTSEGLSTLTQTTSDKKLLLILFMLSIVMLSGNVTASTAISRDGASQKLNLFLPIPLKSIIYAKLFVAYAITIIPFIIMVAVGVYIHIPWHILVSWICIALVYNWLSTMINFMIDLYHPKLHWTDEQELFKGRYILFLLSLAQTAIFGILTIIIWKANITSFYPTVLILGSIMLILTCIVQGYLSKKIKLTTLQNIETG
ncbi:ABC transporter permease [Oceanobacillus sp. J11TS1]|nr:ABC transporter permease [Oceanobacillus sp. J11TS1]